MARYTSLLPVPATTPRLRDSIADSLRACGLSMVYETGDYLMAKEQPGHVSLAQLTTIEVLINPPTTAAEVGCVSLVVRNEELALSRNNHCEKVFSTVNQALVDAV